VLGLRLGRRCDRRQDPLDDEPRHDRCARQDDEWETHCRGAINNGVSKDEIRAIIHVIGIYCGVPQALECFRVAKKVWVIVDQSDNLVGSVSVIKEWSDWNAGYYWWIQGMYLLPAYRGKGLMKSMIDEVESEMNKSGGLELRLYVHTENHAAIRAYEKAKFTDSKYRIMVLNKKD
jgi:ribosomal protein S18 acetylase RimI-like enzyme